MGLEGPVAWYSKAGIPGPGVEGEVSLTCCGRGGRQDEAAERAEAPDAPGYGGGGGGMVQGRGVETVGSRGEAGGHDFIRNGVNCRFS